MSEVIVRMEMPKKCIDCCVRSNCELYMNELRKPFEQRDFEAIKPLGSKGCLIRGVLPEQHGNLIDGDIAKARIHKNIIDYYENGSGGYYLAEDAEEEVRLMVEHESIITATERSEANGNAD